MKKIMFMPLFLVLLYTNASAGGGAATSVLTLLEPLSAVSAGTAESSVASLGASHLLNSNPASVYGVVGPEVGFIYRKGVMEDSYTAGFAVIPVENIFIGTGIQYYTTGNVSIHNLYGNKLTEVGQKDTIFHLAYAMKVSDMPLGVNLKIIRSEIFGESGASFALDFGGVYTEFYENINLGFAVRNVSWGIKYVDKYEDIPFNVAGGLNYEIEFSDSSLNAKLELPYYIHEAEVVSLTGVEYNYRDKLSLRGGYRFNLSEPGIDDVSLSMGIGLTIGNYTFDYAAGIADDLDSTHSVSFGVEL